MKEVSPLSVAWDAWLAKRAGLPTILERQQQRFKELIAFARKRSRYYARNIEIYPRILMICGNYPLSANRI